MTWEVGRVVVRKMKNTCNVLRLWMGWRERLAGVGGKVIWLSN